MELLRLPSTISTVTLILQTLSLEASEINFPKYGEASGLRNAALVMNLCCCDSILEKICISMVEKSGHTER